MRVRDNMHSEEVCNVGMLIVGKGFSAFEKLKTLFTCHTKAASTKRALFG